MLKRCAYFKCQKEFSTTNPRRKFCNQTCCTYNLYHTSEDYRKKVKRRAKEWDLKNPDKRRASSRKALEKFRTEKRERFNELMVEGYRRNRQKWRSRRNTAAVLYGRYRYRQMENPPEKICSKCKSKENIQIHHEIYPTSATQIKEAIEKGKIYYLCRKCHIDKHNVDTK